MDENNKFDVVGTNIAEKATMIWNVAKAVNTIRIFRKEPQSVHFRLVDRKL